MSIIINIIINHLSRCRQVTEIYSLTVASTHAQTTTETSEKCMHTHVECIVHIFCISHYSPCWSFYTLVLSHISRTSLFKNLPASRVSLVLYPSIAFVTCCMYVRRLGLLVNDVPTLHQIVTPRYIDNRRRLIIHIYKVILSTLNCDLIN